MIELPLTYMDSKTLFTSIGKTPCLVTDESISFQFACNAKLIVRLGLFDSIESYRKAMSIRGDVLYFDRRLIWDVDDDLTIVADLKDDVGIVNSSIVLIKGDGAAHLKDVLKGRLGGMTPHDVFQNNLLKAELNRLSRLQIGASLGNMGGILTPETDCNTPK